MKAASGYLFWATVFRLYTVFGVTFSRFAMKECINAGREGRPFPIQEVLEQTRGQRKDLTYARKKIPLPQDDPDRREMVHQSGRLFLSVAQSIRFADRERVEWDHIYAQALAARTMKWKGPEGEWRRQYRQDACLVWRIGNLCALDKALNESAQADPPGVKLSKLRRGEYGRLMWPEDLFMPGDLEKVLIDAEKLLQTNRTDEGMQTFRCYVEAREDELWHKAAQGYPEAELFAQTLRLDAQ